jgi:hypothetical protein
VHRWWRTKTRAFEEESCDRLLGIDLACPNLGRRQKSGLMGMGIAGVGASRVGCYRSCTWQICAIVLCVDSVLVLTIITGTMPPMHICCMPWESYMWCPWGSAFCSSTACCWGDVFVDVGSWCYKAAVRQSPIAPSPLSSQSSWLLNTQATRRPGQSDQTGIAPRSRVSRLVTVQPRGPADIALRRIQPRSPGVPSMSILSRANGYCW